MPRPLRIGVNALYLIPGGVGGTEVYLRNILTAIAAEPREHQYVVFYNEETGPGLVPDSPAFRGVATGVRAESRPRRILYEQTGLLKQLSREKIDVVYNPGFTSPHLASCPNVTLIHDLQHHRHPEYFSPADLLAWRFFVWASAHRSARLLTVSGASREDIHAVYKIPLDRIDVAEPGVEQSLFHLELQPTEPLILCVSTLHPHKNIERLVDAFAAFRKTHPEYVLTLAGMKGFHYKAVEARIRHHNLETVVKVTGWISRPEIFNLYARAEFAVFPSTFEGFGMPVAEAMAAGVPLITSNIRPMTDIAEGTALLFPPEDTKALTAAMEKFAASPAIRKEHAKKARPAAARYTWARAAAITLNALEAAAK